MKKGYITSYITGFINFRFQYDTLFCDENEGCSYYVESLIGNGSYGYIFKAYNTKTKTVVAIKEMDINSIFSRNEQNFYRYVLKEIKDYEQYFPKIYGIFNSKKHCYIVMEYFDLGHFRHSVLKDMTFEEFVGVFKKILEILSVIHNHNVIMNDIKCDNILLKKQDGRYKVRIVDYGLVSFFDHVTQTKRGSPLYYPPELFVNTGDEVVLPNAKKDIWAFGITVYIGLMKSTPMSRIIYWDAIGRIKCIKEELPNVIDKMVTNFKNDVNIFRGSEKIDNVLDIFKQCIQIDFRDRPMARDILEDRFLKDMEVCL